MTNFLKNDMIKYQILLMTLIVCGVISCQVTETSKEKDIELFHLSQVELLPGPFLDAQAADYGYMMKMDVDRLLAPYLEDAGFDPVKPHYSNWEGSGLNGHIGGHYLSALAMMYASTGQDSLKTRLDYMIDWLAKCQEANGNGYVGGIPDGKRIWNEIANGKIDAGSFSLNGGWVPIYNIHKLFAGLKDAYVFTGNEKALQIWVDLSDWWINMMSQLSEEQIQEILSSEHGGINEVFADLYVETQDKKYLDMAEKLNHRTLLGPLMASHDSLTGMHANTQIPKVVGFQRIAAITKNDSLHEAADYFWDKVVNERSISIGGNSVREHFHPIDDFSSMVSSEQGPETCNTYNMLRLSKELFLVGGNPKYLDFYERGLYNHILSSQHPDGGFVYFTPARPRHCRVYSQPDEGMWCCVGSGLENHTKYGELIYAHQGSDLLVNLFIPSVLNWEGQNIKLTQQTDFPDEDQTSFKIELANPKEFTLKIRIPVWVVEDAFEIYLNDEKLTRTNLNAGYAEIDREWSNGDEVTVVLPMQTILEQLPDGSSWYSFVRGPIVMAAITDSTDLNGLWADDGRMSHVAHGPFYPAGKAPMLIGNETSILNAIHENASGPFTLSYSGSVYPDTYENLKLVPFYTVHEARYMLYWPVTDSAGLASKIKSMEAAEKERLALNAMTVDYVSPGEQQPESDHGFKGERTFSGYENEQYWRSSRDWFSYDLSNHQLRAKYLKVTYLPFENSNFKVYLNEKEFASENQASSHEGEEITQYYDLKEFSKINNLTIKFQANDGSIISRVLDVRLINQMPDQTNEL